VNVRQNMQKKRFIFFFFVCLLVEGIQAQLDPQFSQYMKNQAATNPGSIAQNEMLDISGIYKQQWAGFKNAPENMFFSVSMPLTISETKHGMGIGFFRNSAGLFKNQSVLLQYSYKMKLFNGVLGLGVNVGFVNQTFNRNDADPTGNGGQIPDGDDYHSQNDPLLSGASEDDDIVFDAGFGAFFTNENAFAGLSVLHLTAPETNFGGSTKLYIPRIFYLAGGYNISLSNTFYVLQPSAQVRTDLSSYQIELSCLLEYDKKIHGGISYRLQDAVIFMLGLDLFNGLNIGYAYDLPISKMIKSGGSHEIFLRYSFKLEFAKKNKVKAIDVL
jgi:type IX secretion system PorP/SprF family membrane protein